MKQLLFLPVDLDTSLLNNLIQKNTKHLPNWNPYWNVSEVEITNELKMFCQQLPITRISKVYCKTQEKLVDIHKDTNKDLCDPILYENLYENEPAGFHIILKGKRNALSICNGLEFVRTYMPETTNSYIMGITETLHKVDNDPGRLTIFIRGFIDAEKHKIFVSKNLEKYSNYAIYEN